MSYALPHTITKFGRVRRNSSKCLARGCKGGFAGEVRLCDERLFESMEIRRESRWEGRERPVGRDAGYLQELSQARQNRTHSVRQIHSGGIGIYG
jgi:hypothetical protein